MSIDKFQDAWSEIPLVTIFVRWVSSEWARPRNLQTPKSMRYVE
jgi:hypothetical protein